MKQGILSISWGKWGGFYRYRARGQYLHTIRICCGWVAITYIGGLEIDDLMEGYGDAGELRAGVYDETKRLRLPAGMGDERAVRREREFTAELLDTLLAKGRAAHFEATRPGQSFREAVDRAAMGEYQ